MGFEEYLKETYGSNEPIYIEEIAYKNYSRSWIFTELKKLVDTGCLKRFDKGIYFFSEKMPWGETTLDPRKIVYKRFLSDGKDVYGYVAGFSLLNVAGISTQVPNFVELVSNRESARVRDVYIGYQRIVARRSRTMVTSRNWKVLQVLDLLTNINPRFMDELELFMLEKFIKESEVTREMLEKYAKYFPAKAMKNLVESGLAYEFAS